MKFLFNPNQKYACIDGESCNLNLCSLNNKPWQWGILDCQGENIVKKHNLYIRWPDGINVSKDAARVTRYNPFLVEKEGMSPETVLEILDSYIYNPEYKLLVHNGLQFDVYLHNIHRLSLGKKTDYSYIYRILDSNAISKGIKLEEKYKGEYNDFDFLCYQYRMAARIKKGLKTNLTFLGKENKIDVNYDNLHDGSADVELLWLVWNKWIKRNMV